MNWIHQPLIALKFLSSLWRDLIALSCFQVTLTYRLEGNSLTITLSHSFSYLSSVSSPRKLLVISLQKNTVVIPLTKNLLPWYQIYILLQFLWLFMYTKTFCFSVESWFNMFEGISYAINLDICITNNIHKYKCYAHICTITGNDNNVSVLSSQWW